MSRTFSTGTKPERDSKAATPPKVTQFQHTMSVFSVQKVKLSSGPVGRRASFEVDHKLKGKNGCKILQFDFE